MSHAQELRPKSLITCINYLLRAHEAFEAALQGDRVRYQTLLARLDSRSLAWLAHLVTMRGLESHFQKLDAAGTLPAPPLINFEGVLR